MTAWTSAWTLFPGARCLVCQNQTIAAHKRTAVELRRQVRELLRAGKSEKEVVQFMTERYGDFVVYRPPVRTDTCSCGLDRSAPRSGLGLLARRSSASARAALQARNAAQC